MQTYGCPLLYGAFLATVATEPIMNLSYYCPVNASRCLTLNDLINSGSRWNPVFEHDERVVFQSEIHLVNGTQN